MSEDTPPDELAYLEQALAGRALPAPPAGLRLRALGEVRRARARERNLRLAAAAATVLTVLGLGLSTPPQVEAAGSGPAGPQPRDEHVLEQLGLDPADARSVARRMHLAGVPLLAAPIGSGAAPSLREEGL